MRYEVRGAVDLMAKMYRTVLPSVRQELRGWRAKAAQIPDPELRRQALASIRYKRFHCEGGSVFSLLGGPAAPQLIPLIVAFQTISDYLDNLCDRSTSQDEEDFRQLHLALADAVHPHRPLSDYYLHRREKEDGGYLAALVRCCQQQVEALPSYAAVYTELCRLVSLYCEMQVFKHLEPARREEELRHWHARELPSLEGEHHQLYWNEFAAASGSTLGIFLLFALAAQPELAEGMAKEASGAYYPWVCGLHILLDYLIDQEEDEIGGDLNFISAYRDEELALRRMMLFLQRAQQAVARLPQAHFHQMVVEGLLGVYLSNRKVQSSDQLRQMAQSLLRRIGWRARFFYWNGRILLGRAHLLQPGG